ncbi:RNA polymerase sigma factor [Nonomuraea cavernae]|uniref:RNA polymerase sigma factor n=1 Tax=Nonomuraea cavernae TaxID=2045107 RepID=UPI0033F4844F
MWRTLSEDTREAVRELCDGYGPHLYDYCRTELASSDAELAVAGALLSAQARADRVEQSSLLRPWLYALARAHRAYLATPTSVGSWSRPGRMSDLLPEALRALDPSRRELLDLSVRHGLTSAEIAVIFDVSPDEVETIVLEAADGLEEWFAAVIAARTRHGCPALESRVTDWASTPGRRTRARISRHIARCGDCRRAPRTMVADTLLRQMPIAPAPSTLGEQLAWALPLPGEAGMWRDDGFPTQVRGLTEPAPPPISSVPGPTTGTRESSGPVAGAAAAGPEHTDDLAAHRTTSRHARPGPPDQGPGSDEEALVTTAPIRRTAPGRARGGGPILAAPVYLPDEVTELDGPVQPAEPAEPVHAALSGPEAAARTGTGAANGIVLPAPTVPGPDWAIVRRARGGVPYRNLPAASAHDRSTSGPAGRERDPSRRAEGGPPWEHQADDGPPGKAGHAPAMRIRATAEDLPPAHEAGGEPVWARGRDGEPPWTGGNESGPAWVNGGQVMELRVGPDEFWQNRPDETDSEPAITIRTVARVGLFVGVGILVAGLAWSGLNARQRMTVISEMAAPGPVVTPAPGDRPSPQAAVPVPPPGDATPAASPVESSNVGPTVAGTMSPAEPSGERATGASRPSETGTTHRSPVKQAVLPRPKAPMASLTPTSISLDTRRTGSFALACRGGACRVTSVTGSGGIAVSGRSFRVKAPASRPDCPGPAARGSGTITVRWQGTAKGDGRTTAGTTTGGGTLKLRVTWKVPRDPGPYVQDGEGGGTWTNCSSY